MYKELVLCYHPPCCNPVEKLIEPRLVVLVGLVQDMARSAELKLTHVDGFKLTHVAASITSFKVL